MNYYLWTSVTCCGRSHGGLLLHYRDVGRSRGDRIVEHGAQGMYRFSVIAQIDPTFISRQGRSRTNKHIRPENLADP